MLDSRAARLTVSAMLAKMNLSEMLKTPVAKLGELDEEAVVHVQERLMEEREGVMSAKYVDLGGYASD